VAKGKANTGLDKVLEEFTRLADELAKSVSEPARNAAVAVANFGSQLESGLVGVMRRIVDTAMAPLTAATTLYAAAATGAIALMQNFVSKADPATAFAFNRALDDLAGTMGQILVPVLQAVGGFIREFADVLQGLRPVMQPIMQGVAQVIGVLGSLVGTLASALAPVLSLVGEIIKTVVVPIMETLGILLQSVFVIINPLINIFATILREIIVPALAVLVQGLKQLAEIIKEIVDLIPDLGLSSDVEKGNSVGAAIRPASYGSIEDIGKRTTLAALNMGRGGLTPDGQAITDEQKKTNALLAKEKERSIPRKILNGIVSYSTLGLIEI
jgi:hypothetical protein